MKPPTAERVAPVEPSQREPSQTEPSSTEARDCLAEDALYALARGELETRERSHALAHLDLCELCQTLLAEEVRGLPEFASSDACAHTLVQVGTLVGERYCIDSFVARGGMGEVYKAWDELLGERVALKTINPAASPDGQLKANARFRREAQLSRRVGDPHVCRIYEFGQHFVQGFGPLSYLTMEFIEGQTLGARLRTGPRLSMDEVMVLSHQMLRGLSAAHAVGVLHRDLKSDNVMLRADSGSGALHAVIMDFGLARVLGDEAHGVTERHEFVGSAAYMAPEQLEEAPALSQATDVYAFGVVLYEMLTGRLPFDGKSAMAIAMRRLTHEPLPPSHHVPELPPAWDDVVLRCLEREIERRYDSAEQVRAALDAIEQRSSTPPPSPPRRNARALAIASAAALVAAAGYLLSLGTASDASPGRSSEEVSVTLQPRPTPAAPSPAAPSSAARSSALSAATPPSSALSAAADPSSGEREPAAVPLAEVAPIAPRPTRKERPSARAAASRPSPTPASETVVEATANAKRRPSPAPGDVRDLFFLEPPH